MENKIRTEEEILKDFEELGWIVVDNHVDLVLKRLEKEMFIEIYPYCYIHIDKEKHTYSVIDIHNGANYKHELSMPEHKLLHELFTIWNWI